MSKGVQRLARRMRDVASEGAKNARQRAQNARQRDDTVAARVHEQSGDRMAETAATADGLLKTDRQHEGDLLDDRMSI